MNKTTLFIMSGTIFLTSTYTLAQTRPHNNSIPESIPQVTIPSPEVMESTPPAIEAPTVSTPSPLSGQGADEMKGGSLYKNKQNKGRHKGKNKRKHKNKKYKGGHKGKHKGEGEGKGKHKGKYKDHDGNEDSNSGG